jgi:hypothetical protein
MRIGQVDRSQRTGVDRARGLDHPCAHGLHPSPDRPPRPVPTGPVPRAGSDFGTGSAAE